jgi:hypothetical protein
MGIAGGTGPGPVQTRRGRKRAAADGKLTGRMTIRQRERSGSSRYPQEFGRPSAQSTAPGIKSRSLTATGGPSTLLRTSAALAEFPESSSKICKSRRLA